MSTCCLQPIFIVHYILIIWYNFINRVSFKIVWTPEKCFLIHHIIQLIKLSYMIYCLTKKMANIFDELKRQAEVIKKKNPDKTQHTNKQKLTLKNATQRTFLPRSGQHSVRNQAGRTQEWGSTQETEFTHWIIFPSSSRLCGLRPSTMWQICKTKPPMFQSPTYSQYMKTIRDGTAKF